MASIIEELITVLEKEYELYKDIIPIAQEKTKIIIANDLDSLHRITEQEQEVLDKVNALERKREEVIINVATVMGKNADTLTIKEVIEMLEKQPKEQEQLAQIHGSLKETVYQLIEINNHNNSLVQQSLEMIEFNLNFIQSTRMSPGSNNYTKGASTTDTPVGPSATFDAKQ